MACNIIGKCTASRGPDHVTRIDIAMLFCLPILGSDAAVENLSYSHEVLACCLPQFLRTSENQLMQNDKEGIFIAGDSVSKFKI